MKRRWAIGVLICIFGMAISVDAAEVAKVETPAAFIEESLYEFSPVMEGDAIRHDFLIQNRGTAPLIIEKLKAG